MAASIASAPAAALCSELPFPEAMIAADKLGNVEWLCDVSRAGVASLDSSWKRGW